jgi:hypothetical protein
VLIIAVLTVVAIAGFFLLLRDPAPAPMASAPPAETAAPAPVSTPQPAPAPQAPATSEPAAQAAAAPAEPAPVPTTGPLPPLPMPQFAPARPAEVVRAVYEFAARHPEVLRYVPCFCGCEQRGHDHNEDCFVSSRDAQGRVTWDVHGMG